MQLKALYCVKPSTFLGKNEHIFIHLICICSLTVNLLLVCLLVHI